MTSFIQDKCGNLTLCLRLMVPHWKNFFIGQQASRRQLTGRQLYAGKLIVDENNDSWQTIADFVVFVVSEERETRAGNDSSDAVDVGLEPELVDAADDARHRRPQPQLGQLVERDAVADTTEVVKERGHLKKVQVFLVLELKLDEALVVA